MTLAQVRQQIHFLFFRDRRVRAGNRDPGFGELLQQTDSPVCPPPSQTA
jgi:hypothetical protein